MCVWLDGYHIGLRRGFLGGGGGDGVGGGGREGGERGKKMEFVGKRKERERKRLTGY